MIFLLRSSVLVKDKTREWNCHLILSKDDLSASVMATAPITVDHQDLESYFEGIEEELWEMVRTEELSYRRLMRLPIPPPDEIKEYIEENAKTIKGIQDMLILYGVALHHIRILLERDE